MPPRSKAQQAAIAIAEHDPGKLYKRNQGLLGMTQQQMSEYASGSTKGLPVKITKVPGVQKVKKVKVVKIKKPPKIKV